MKIAINGDIIDTENIYKITEIELGIPDDDYSYLFYIKSLACINTPNQPEMKESLSSWNQIYEMLFAIQKLLKLKKNKLLKLLKI